jgi:hypothetical protein
VNGQHHALVALLFIEMGLGGSQNQSGCSGEEKRLLALPAFELRIFQCHGKRTFKQQMSVGDQIKNPAVFHARKTPSVSVHCHDNKAE